MSRSRHRKKKVEITRLGKVGVQSRGSTVRSDPDYQKRHLRHEIKARKMIGLEECHINAMHNHKAVSADTPDAYRSR
jgi:hypothetical protein